MQPHIVGTQDPDGAWRAEHLSGYPVVCGAPRFADDEKDTLLNPVLIVEVLSKSTEANDRGAKFREYRKIESLQEYVLVSQYSPSIEVFARSENGNWVLREFSGLEEVCQFTSIDCEVAIAEVYRDVTLDPER